MQFPQALVQSWIKPASKVLDLGCGDGMLLRQLIEARDVDGYGVEIDPHALTQCIANGVNVIEQDLDRGLVNFPNGSFDTVVMTQTLQAVHYPHQILDEMLRIGRECIVSFPNFGHWRSRLYLATHGKMPVSKFLPYQWYDTPNIHFCTICDFERLCVQKNIHILNRTVVDPENRTRWIAKRWPNLFGITAIYRITR